jgi:CNT family concentrative nucleoside transporter
MIAIDILEWPGMNQAFLTSLFAATLLTLIVIPFGKRRPLDRKASWGEAMFGSAYVFGVLFLGVYLFVIASAVVSALALLFLDVPPLSVRERAGPQRPLRQIMKQPAFLTSTLAATIAHAVMNFLMTATPIAMVLQCGLARSDADNWPPATRNVAFAVLPTIIFFSALMSLLYYLGVMAPVVRAIAWLMVRTLGTSGSESLSAAGNIFVGQTEAPLLVKPFVATMTRSELMAVMTGGFATVAGGVLGVYVMLLQDALPSIAGHLVVASILSAPAALAMAKMMVPETAQSLTAGEVQLNVEQPASNFIEAAATGATDGMKLVLNVVAMLIAIVALVAMVNWAISWVPLGLCGDGSAGFGYAVTCASGDAARALDLSMILGVAFFPAAVLMGVPVEDWLVVGQLLGEKIVLTELLAYKSLAALVSGPEPVLSQRAAIIASYALCGFANFASIGIQLGGIGGIAPDRMGELAQLGFRAMIAGALAACMTGAVAGVFL